jgi:hypothetical protein
MYPLIVLDLKILRGIERWNPLFGTICKNLNVHEKIRSGLSVYL